LNGQYCCLGVLCDLALIKGFEKEIPISRSHYREIAAFSSGDGALPDAVRQWAGMATREGLVGLPGGYMKMSLTFMNDTDMTFPQIADVIDFFWQDL
jgi:hypothetical protein